MQGVRGHGIGKTSPSGAPAATAAPSLTNSLYKSAPVHTGNFGSTVLRSFPLGNRLSAYVGAGVYYGSANSGVGGHSLGNPSQTGRGNVRANQLDSPFKQNTGSILYATTPVGVRAGVHGNFEVYLEAAYQRTLTGEFGLSQTGQFSGNGSERFGATAWHHLAASVITLSEEWGGRFAFFPSPMSSNEATCLRNTENVLHRAARLQEA